MNLRKTFFSGILAVSMSLSGTAMAADVIMGVPNWPTVKATADILKVIIEDNLGLDVEIQTASNPIVFEAMDAGKMHVHPEVWLPNQQNLHDTYVVEKKTVKMNPYGVPSSPGEMCVTKSTAERTGIKNIEELADPDMAANFDTDDDGKGNIWIGAPGWASTNIEMIRAKSYGYDETMNLDVMDETLAMANVDAAVANNTNIVFMCYTPHHMFTLYNLIPLVEPPYDADKWVVIQPTDDPDWLEKSSAPMHWDTASLHIMFATVLEQDFPEVAKFLSSVQFTTDHLSAMTYAVVVDKIDTADYARDWVNNNQNLVDAWLSS